jgi:hypothetical protein
MVGLKSMREGGVGFWYGCAVAQENGNPTSSGTYANMFSNVTHPQM